MLELNSTKFIELKTNLPQPQIKLTIIFGLTFIIQQFKLHLDKKGIFITNLRLVVGVENMPYKSFFKPLLGEFMLDLGGTVSSRATQKNRTVFTHSTEGSKIAPIICYESIYGEFVTEYARNGAQFFSILTNDAWWGNTQGYKQLLSYARSARD